MGACLHALRCPVLAAAACRCTRSALCSMGRAVSQHKACTARQRQAAHAGDTHGGRCWCWRRWCISLRKSTGATACAAEWEGYAEQCCQCHVALGAARCTVAEEARACAARGRALWVATLTGPAAAVEAGEGSSLPALPPAASDSDADTCSSSGSASSGTHSGSNIDGMIAAAVEVLLSPEVQAGSATAAHVMGAGPEAPAEATLAAVGAATPHEEEEAVAALLAYASVHGVSVSPGAPPGSSLKAFVALPSDPYMACLVPCTWLGRHKIRDTTGSMTHRGRGALGVRGTRPGLRCVYRRGQVLQAGVSSALQQRQAQKPLVAVRQARAAGVSGGAMSSLQPWDVKMERGAGRCRGAVPRWRSQGPAAHASAGSHHPECLGSGGHRGGAGEGAMGGGWLPAPPAKPLHCGRHSGGSLCVACCGRLGGSSWHVRQGRGGAPPLRSGRR